MAESKIKPNPFDPSRFRVVASSDLGGVARKVITHIPVDNIHLLSVGPWLRQAGCDASLPPGGPRA